MQFFLFKKPGPLQLLIVAAACLIVSCDKAYVGFGSDFIDESATNVVYFDTATVDVSSVYVDSFSTTSNSSLFCGDVVDPDFGAIKANSFFSLDVPPATTIPSGSVYDSAQLILNLNGKYYGDTTSVYSIQAHKLDQELNFPSGQTAFYNTSSVAYSAAVSGSVQRVVSPNASDTIALKIDNAIGQDLFNKLASYAPQISGVDLFSDYFKGLAITGDGTNKLILGFDDTIRLRIFYDVPGVFTTRQYIDFGIYRNSKQFYNVLVNRSGTALAGISNSNRQIPSSLTGNKSYGQYITGSLIKIRFPYLRNLLQVPDYVKILKAELVVRPDRNSFNNIYGLPSIAYLADVDQNNTIGNYLSATNSAGGTEIQNGNLYVDHVYGLETAYTFDVTTYIQQQIEVSQNNSNGLVLLPSEFTIFDRFVIGNGQNSQNKIELKLYYVSFK